MGAEDYDKIKKTVIEIVAENGLCSGCGVCAGVCVKNRLKIKKIDNGDKAVVWNERVCDSWCGMCLEVCPFSRGVYDPREINVKLFNENNTDDDINYHEEAGYYDSIFVGYSAIHRNKSASGGYLTWTLEYLLENKKVDKVAVVVGEYNEKEKSYSFKLNAAQTVEDIRRGAGSVYQQIDFEEIIKIILNEPEVRWSVTGVPCVCYAIRKAMLSIPKMQRSIKYLFGLACGMYQNSFYTDLLCSVSGVDRSEIRGIQYRQKACSYSSSNYRFVASDKNGLQGRFVEYHDLPLYLGKNAFFRINACNYCMDVFSESADACFMDAWLPQYNDDFAGTSIVIIRKKELSEVYLSQGIKNNICASEIVVDEAVRSQLGHVINKRYMIRKREKKYIYKFDFDLLGWYLQMNVQRISKIRWSLIGKRCGYKCYMIFMADLHIIIFLYDIVNRLKTHLFIKKKRGSDDGFNK